MIVTIPYFNLPSTNDLTLIMLTFSGDNGPATSAKLNISGQGIDLRVDRSGNIYFPGSLHSLEQSFKRILNLIAHCSNTIHNVQSYQLYPLLLQIGGIMSFALWNLRQTLLLLSWGNMVTQALRVSDLSQCSTYIDQFFVIVLLLFVISIALSSSSFYSCLPVTAPSQLNLSTYLMNIHPQLTLSTHPIK